MQIQVGLLWGEVRDLAGYALLGPPRIGSWQVQTDAAAQQILLENVDKPHLICRRWVGARPEWLRRQYPDSGAFGQGRQQQATENQCPTHPMKALQGFPQQHIRQDGSEYRH